LNQDLFATARAPQVQMDRLGGEIPTLAIDNIYLDPLAIRRAVLALDFSPGTAHYPGRVARFPPGDPSLVAFLRKVVALIDRHYLPLLPTLPDGRRAERIKGLDTDFAITDTHPDQLSPAQRRPHIDAVPIFGLIYLNEEDRGGTLFFKPRQAASQAPHAGYQSGADADVELCGKIEGRFNRLAIYPGFVLHSGEIKGDWIRTEDRFTAPRLTQRLMFFL
jgi:hypothetical protein